MPELSIRHFHNNSDHLQTFLLLSDREQTQLPLAPSGDCIYIPGSLVLYSSLCCSTCRMPLCFALCHCLRPCLAEASHIYGTYMVHLMPCCHKTVSVAGSSENTAIIEMVAGASSPEEAARLGRRYQRSKPAAVRPDWDQAKLQVMLAALRAKVSTTPLAVNCQDVNRLTAHVMLHTM